MCCCWSVVWNKRRRFVPALIYMLCSEMSLLPAVLCCLVLESTARRVSSLRWYSLRNCYHRGRYRKKTCVRLFLSTHFAIGWSLFGGWWSISSHPMNKPQPVLRWWWCPKQPEWALRDLFLLHHYLRGSILHLRGHHVMDWKWTTTHRQLFNGAFTTLVWASTIVHAC